MHKINPNVPQFIKHRKNTGPSFKRFSVHEAFKFFEIISFYIFHFCLSRAGAEESRHFLLNGFIGAYPIND